MCMNPLKALSVVSPAAMLGSAISGKGFFKKKDKPAGQPVRETTVASSPYSS